MESESKRRKLDHGSSGLRHAGLINFESPSSAQISTASTFVLQTEELLKEAKLDYGRHLKDADAQLFQLKTIVDSIGPHDPIPVSRVKRTTTSLVIASCKLMPGLDCRGDRSA